MSKFSGDDVMFAKLGRTRCSTRSQKDRLRNICKLRGETNERQKVSQLWTITCSLRFHIVTAVCESNGTSPVRKYRYVCGT
jgi:hypothetical protein